MRSLRSPSRMPSTRVDDSVTPYQSEPFFARTQTIAESAVNHTVYFQSINILWLTRFIQAPVIALNETLRQREMQFVQREVQSAASTADLAQQMPTVQQSAQVTQQPYFDPWLLSALRRLDAFNEILSHFGKPMQLSRRRSLLPRRKMPIWQVRFQKKLWKLRISNSEKR